MTNAVHTSWKRSLADAIRDPDELVTKLELPDELRPAARRAAQLFPVMVTQSYLDRMERGNAEDPLLRQILPLDSELEVVPGFSDDAVHDNDARLAPGLLQKYAGRALLIATGACAIHCRYCFRRSYPYGEEPRTIDQWQPALDALASDESITEIILSGGDPLMLTDERLEWLVARLDEIPHLRRLRVHSRLPIVLPDRVTDRLLELLSHSRLTAFMVIHANHVREISGDCSKAIHRMVNAGITVLNQAVLLRGVNDSVVAQFELCERLVDLGAIPYYLHQLDRVTGTAHFEVASDVGLAIVDELRRRLPGYAVPEYVAELPGEASKMPVARAGLQNENIKLEIAN